MGKTFNREKLIDQANDPTFTWSSEPEVADTIVALAKLMKADKVAEIGIYVGYTSVEIAERLPKGSYVGIDLEDRLADDTREYLLSRDAKLMLGKSSHEVLPELPARSVDIIFIDSVHEFNFLMKEFKMAERVIKRGGFILLHDSLLVPDVARFVDYLRQYRHFEIVTLPTSEDRGLTLVKCNYAQ